MGSVAGVRGFMMEMTRPSAVQDLKTSSGGAANNRATSSKGALTRLDANEISAKLQQVPLFVALTDDSNGIYTTDGEGKLFVEKIDAERYAAEHGGRQVAATTMDAVYFPLIAKQQQKKTESVAESPIAAGSDHSARYTLQAAPGELQDSVSAAWLETHPSDVPLFGVKDLAFSKPTGLKIPLFTRRQDAIDTYKRLLASRSRSSSGSSSGVGRGRSSSSIIAPAADAAAPAITATPATEEPQSQSPAPIQVTSLLDMIALFTTGGFESRALEIYPSMDAFEAASTLSTAKS